jgi:hypothetical protein
VVYVACFSVFLFIHRYKGTDNDPASKLKMKIEITLISHYFNIFLIRELIKYKKSDNLDGPLYWILKSAVIMVKPQNKNLHYPNPELMKNSEYFFGYTQKARKIKQGKVWLNWGIGNRRFTRYPKME